MKKNWLPLLGIAFVAAVLGTGLFYGLFAGRISESERAGVKRVVVAGRNLSRGEMVRAADVKLVPWGNAAPPAGALADTSEAINQKLLENVSAEEPITRGRLGTEKSAGGLGVPVGMRAVSIRVQDSPGVAGLLRPGHRVDVQHLAARPGPTGELELRAIAQDLEVLAINPQVETAPSRSGLVVVTLLTSPAEADILSLADAGNRLRLTLRNPLDRGRTEPSTLAAGSLTGGRGGAGKRTGRSSGAGAN